MNRLLFAVLLALALATLGFALTLVWATEFVYPGARDLGRGLARLSMAIYGGFGGFAAGILFGFVLKPKQVRRTAVAAAVLGVVTLGLQSARMAIQQAEWAAENSAADTAAKLIPPPVPSGADMLRGLVTVPPEMLSQFETQEHAYEEEGVTGYGYDKDWYLVGLRDGGRVWLNKGQAIRYFPVQELVLNRNNYLTEFWDTRIRDVPDESTPSRQVPIAGAGRQEIPAKVLEAREAGGMWWFRVEILDGSPCDGGTPKIVESGWIPAWGGPKPTAWYYPRGC